MAGISAVMTKILAVPKKAAVAKHVELSPLEALKAAVIEGEADEIRSLVENALNTGIEPNELTEKALTAAMNEVGVDFGAAGFSCLRFCCLPRLCAVPL